jgi:hypothetical protein
MIRRLLVSLDRLSPRAAPAPRPAGRGPPQAPADPPHRSRAPGASARRPEGRGMSLSATVRALVAAGGSPEMILAVVEAHEASAGDALQQRRAKDAARQQAKRERDNVTSRDVRHVTDRHAAAPPSPAPSPRPPTPPTPTRGITTQARDDGFAEFWAAYPRKVGKPLALKAYRKALLDIPGPDPPQIVLAGLRAHLPGWAEAEPEMIPHPTTWLNRDGWNDQPPSRGPRLAHDRSRPAGPTKLERTEDNLRRSLTGFEIASRARGAG